ncbi:MAG: hypothetical protein ABW215_12795 [Kibdelosporangium sp.]
MRVRIGNWAWEPGSPERRDDLSLSPCSELWVTIGRDDRVNRRRAGDCR